MPLAKFGKRTTLSLAIGVTVLSCMLMARAVSNHVPYFGFYQDDALYVVGARSLAEGDGYRILSLPGEPWQTKYPILFPMALSIVWMVLPSFPLNVLSIERLCCFFALSFAIAAPLYLFLTRRVTARLALLIYIATALNLKFLSFSPMAMSDFLYGTLSIIGLYLADLISRKPTAATTKATTLGLGLIEALAMLTRTAGNSLALSATFCLASIRKFRAAALSAASFLVIAVPYWMWCKANEQVLTPLLTFYTSYSGWVASAYQEVNPATLVTHKLGDAYTAVMHAIWPMLDNLRMLPFTPLTFALAYGLGFTILWIALLIGIAVCIMRKHTRLPALYTLVYMLGMAAWPGFTEWRQILVIMPFLLYFSMKGIRAVSYRIKGKYNKAGRQRWQRTCAAIAVTFGVYLAASSIVLAVTRSGHYPRLAPFRADLTAKDELTEFQEVYKWVRSNTPPDAVFVCNNDPLFYLQTGRKAVQPSAYEAWRSHSARLIDEDSVRASIKDSNATYLVLDPSFGAAYLAYAQYGVAVQQLIGRSALTPVYVSPRKLITVFKIVPAAL